MQFAATSIRRTALAEKVYAKAAEIETARREAQLEKQRAIREARERIEAKFKHWPCERVFTIKGRATVRGVLVATCQLYKLTPGEITAYKKIPGVLEARQVGMYLAYEHTEASYTQIGEIFQRDHTTVINNVNRIKKYLSDGNQHICDCVRAIRNLMAGLDPDDDGNYWGA